MSNTSIAYVFDIVNEKGLPFKAVAFLLKERVIIMEEELLKNKRKEDILEFWKTLFPECSMDEMLKIFDEISEKSAANILEGREENKIDTNIYFEYKNNYNSTVLKAFQEIKKEFRWIGFCIPIIDYYACNLVQVLEKSIIVLNEENILKDVIISLAESCHKIIYRTIVLELNLASEDKILIGNNQAERGSFFSNSLLESKKYLKEIYQIYPALIEQLDVKVKNYINFIIEILTNTEVNFDNIVTKLSVCKTPGKLIGIQTGSGDTHNNGKTVAILKFENVKIVYKPRSLEIDKKFGDFIGWLNGLNIPGFKNLKTAKAYFNKNDGWMEFVSFQECQQEIQIEKFYHKIGQLLCIFYTMNTGDIHYENIIAHGEDPVVIDLETLFHPVITNYEIYESDLKRELQKKLKESVSSIALLPTFIISKEQAIDIGGMSLTEPQRSPYKGHFIKGYELDNPQIVEDYGFIMPSQNNPKIAGTNVKADSYITNILLGFSCVYNWIRNNKKSYIEKLQQLFAHEKCRFVFRPTNNYARFLDTSYHPDVLHSVMDRLVYLYRLGITANKNNVAIIREEIASLAIGDIPYFYTYTDEKNLYAGNEKKLGECFIFSPIEMSINKIKRMNCDDYEEQTAIIKNHYRYSSIYKTSTNISFASKSSRITNIDSIKLAEQIGELVRRKSISGRTAKNKIGTTWIGLKSFDDKTHYLDEIGNDIYSGNSGIALFYSYLAKVTGKREWYDYLEEVLQPIYDNIDEFGGNFEENIGAFAGTFGQLYVLLKIGITINDLKKIDVARKRVLDIFYRIKENIQSHDIINGYAGILGIMVLILEKYKDLELIAACDYIVDKLHETSCSLEGRPGITWGDAASGYAHGNTGVSAQLFRFYQLNKNIKAKRLVDEAVLFDRTLTDDKNGMWHKTVNNSAIVYTWCNGEAGVLLNRLMLKGLGYKDANLDNEITNLVNGVIKDGFGNDYAICHGDLGNLAILKYAASLMNRSDISRYCHETFLDFIGKYYNLKKLKLNSNWGLMTGLTGVGISLLDDYCKENMVCEILELK